MVEADTSTFDAPTARFTATVAATGKTTTGIPVPDQAVAHLGRGKRAKVTARLGGGYTYRTTLGSHEGATFLSVSAAVRRPPESRARRVEAAVAALAEGRKRPSSGATGHRAG